MNIHTTLPRPRRVVVVALAALLALGLTAADAAAQTGALQGLVTDASDGQPIEGAMVFVRVDGDPGGPPGFHGPGHARAFTDASGQYLVEGLPPGEATIVCGAVGYQRADATATIVDGQTAVADFALDPIAFGSVGGTVTDAATGLPIAGAHVMLFRSWGGPGGGGNDTEPFPIHAVTGDDGAYLVEDVPAGDWFAVASSWGYTRPDPVPVTVTDGQLSVVDFALEPYAFGSLEGTVTDAASGLPVEGATVVAFTPWGGGPGSESDRGWHRVVTDASGFYRFDQVVAGSYEVLVWSSGYEPGGGPVDVVDGQTAVLDVALVPLTFGSVAGVVTDAATGAGVEDAHVQLFPAEMAKRDAEWGWLSARTDATGAYQIEDVPAGDYYVRVWAHGYVPGEPLVVTVTDGATATADVALDPIAYGALEGTVTDSSTGAPIEGAMVRAWRGWGGPGGERNGFVVAVTDATGHYEFPDLVEGTWNVAVHAFGYQRGLGQADVVSGQTVVLDFALDPS